MGALLLVGSLVELVKNLPGHDPLNWSPSNSLFRRRSEESRLYQQYIVAQITRFSSLPK